MAKTKISEFSANPANNTDIDSINIAEGCAPSGINDAIRELMAQLKDFQVGSAGDPVTVGGVLTVTAGAVGTPAITTAGDTNTGIFFPAADTIAFSEGGAEIARFDSSGNLGVGTASPVAKLQVAGAYRQTGATVPFEWTVNAGAQDFYKLNAVGFADNLIVANSAGNVGIGTSSPTSKLQVGTGAAASTVQAQILGGVTVFENAGATASVPTITFNNDLDTGINNPSGNTLALYTGGSERMRIDSSGNLGIGTSSPGAKLHVNGASLLGSSTFFVGDDGGSAGAFLNQSAATPMRFLTSGSERARIASDGTIVFMGYGSGDPVMRVGPGLSGTGSARVNVQDRSGTFAAWFTGTTQVGSISTNGSITLYNTTSDERLKENIEDAASASTLIDALQVREYDWKADGSHQRYGFIAQELLTVAPEAVYQPEDPEEMMAVDYAKLVPMLVKEIQSLRVRVQALESN
jgi:hypothetical protein